MTRQLLGGNVTEMPVPSRDCTCNALDEIETLLSPAVSPALAETHRTGSMPRGSKSHPSQVLEQKRLAISQFVNVLCILR